VPDPDTDYLLVSYEESYIPFTNLITYMDRYVQICQGTDTHFHSKRRIDH